MNANTLSFERIFNAEFGNANLNEITKKLSENNLFAFLLKSLNQINEHMLDQTEELKLNGALNVAPIGAIMLIKFNEQFRSLTIEKRLKEKEELEYILGSFMKRTIKLVIDAVPLQAKQKQLALIARTLHDTCKLFNYDFDELSDFLRINDLVLEVRVEVKSDSEIILPTQKQLPGFCYSGLSHNQLPALMKILNKADITQDNENFVKLFNNPQENLAIELNKNKVVNVLQFMSVLKNSGLVSFQNCNGFYQVLCCHVIDFSSVFLNGKSPQRRIDMVKQLKSWPVMKERFESQLKSLVM